jgi:hypothetical protein
MGRCKSPEKYQMSQCSNLSMFISMCKKIMDLAVEIPIFGGRGIMLPDSPAGFGLSIDFQKILETPLPHRVTAL